MLKQEGGSELDFCPGQYDPRDEDEVVLEIAAGCQPWLTVWVLMASFTFQLHGPTGTRWETSDSLYVSDDRRRSSMGRTPPQIHTESNFMLSRDPETPG